jgi:aspartyl-tRNA(Asn)/glutamyl-tRNA(Gln) amidotransferase subunit C
MSIDKDKIIHTSKLARISLEEKKVDSLSKDLSNIFNFIEIKTDDVKPLTSILDHSLRTRDDQVTDGSIREKVLGNAPNKNEEFFIVPKVIE